jgi:hypothetical protein
MKKLLGLGLAGLLILGGCSNAGNDKKDSAHSNESSTSDSIAGDMMDFYLSIITSVNGVDQDLNGYEAAMAEDVKPTGDELKTLQTKASESAMKTSQTIKDMKVPGKLDKYKSDIQDSLDTLAESYQMKADLLKKGGDVVLDEANDKFTSAEDKLGMVLEKTGLSKSSLNNDLNG